MLALSSRASKRICLLHSELNNITGMLLQARLASGSAASCSSRAATMSPTVSPQQLAPQTSLRSRLSSVASLPFSNSFASPMLLSRMLGSLSGYKKSPGVRTRLEASAAARGKTDVDAASSSSADAAGAVSSSQPPAAAAAAVPRRTVEQIVKRITRADVALQFARSGGAGGQNVNKVNTKADLRLSLDSADWLEPELVEAVKRAEKKRINKEGELVVTSTASRSQAANVDDALAKMQAILDAAAKTLIPPDVDPEKAKQIEKALKAGNEVRLDLKKKKADKKKERRAPIDW